MEHWVARDLVASSSQYLIRTGALVTGTPATLACWFKSYDTSHLSRLVGVGQFNSSAANMLGLAFYGGSGSKISALHRKGGGDEGDAQTSTTISDGNWHHAAAVFTSNSSRSAYLDGGGKSTNTTSVTAIASADRTIVGGLLWTSSTIIQLCDGAVAEVGIWNAALSDDDVAALAMGYSPKLVRPDALVSYFPFVQDDGDRDDWSNYPLAAQNAPGYADHPPIIYPSRPRIIRGGGSSPPATTIYSRRSIGGTRAGSRKCA